MKRSLIIIAIIAFQAIGLSASAIPVSLNMISNANSNDSIIINALVTDAICTSQSGSIRVEIEGGVPPYIFNWTGPDGFTSSLQNIDELIGGTFTLSVTDSDNNTVTKSITVGSTHREINMQYFTTNAICGGEGGQIHVNISGDSEPYTFAWTGPDGFTSSLNSLSDLKEGIYMVVVTDYYGCEKSETFTIHEQNSISINGIIYGNPICDIDGSLNLLLRGDTIGYKYSWTGPDGFTAFTPEITGLKSGLYTCVITDKNGCTKTFSHNLKNIGNQPPVILSDSVSASSIGETSFEILSNDMDLDGTINLMSLKLVDGPLHGTVRFTENGEGIYTPQNNYIGPDIFSYQICDNGIPCGEECGIAYVYINVVLDTIPPLFEGVLPDLHLECLSEVPAQYLTLEDFNQSGMVASDNFEIDSSAFQISEFSKTINCITTLERNYTVVDFSGNTTTIGQTLTVEDTQDPTLKCPPNIILSLDHPVPAKFTTLESFVTQGGSVTDNCEIDPGSFFNMSESIDTLSNSILIRRAYYVEDFCRNGDICLHQIEIETGTNSMDLSEANDFKVSVYPNPSNGQFSIRIDVPQSADVQIEIIDINGKSVFSETHQCSSGTNVKDISMQNMAQGTYMLKSKSGGSVVVEKVVVQ